MRWCFEGSDQRSCRKVSKEVLKDHGLVGASSWKGPDLKSAGYIPNISWHDYILHDMKECL